MRSYFIVLAFLAGCAPDSEETVMCEGFEPESSAYGSYETVALPEFELTSPDFTDLFPGNQQLVSHGGDVQLDFSVRSKNQCGALELNAFRFQVASGQSWTEELTDEENQARLESSTLFQTFSVVQGNPSLSYSWVDDDRWPESLMPTQAIEANETVDYQFSWNVNRHVPKMGVFVVSLLAVTWTDVETGTVIPWYWPEDEGNVPTVHVEAVILP